MFKGSLEVIWEKVLENLSETRFKEAITFKDKTILWANDMGFFGLMFGVLALLFLFMRIVGGDDATFFGITNWTYVCVFVTLFCVKSWLGIEKIWKEQWNKLFPTGLVIPYINKKIK